MANLFNWLFGYSESAWKARLKAGQTKLQRDFPPRPEPPSILPSATDETLPPLKHWSHPFKDKSHSLLQLTQMAHARGGYYPLGRNGLWHGGVHFDSGTAEVFDQSSVHCLADGEVVAYRIDPHLPTTAYHVMGSPQPVEKPFSRNFVLVRHHLQPPKIEGSPDTPPSLIFYSLYMHLREWAAYREDAAIARPAFWPESAIRHVKATVNDARHGHPQERGLNVRNQAWQGKVIDLLPRGAEVVVSGDGDYRKLENSPGPSSLKSAEGALLGYVSISVLESLGENQYRFKGNGELNVRAQASGQSPVIAKLPTGTEMTVSGEGEFRKLEHINQYVHFNSLQGAREPLNPGQVVVLDQPVPIKAGDLIGHIGCYQKCYAEEPEEKLHLEVFSGEGVDDFIEASRAWAERLPATEKTWLKLAKGTAVVPHQDRFSATRRPSLSETDPFSAADLLLPKKLLDDLPAERKIVVPATSGGKAYNWYRLDGLLNDADHHLLDGWVREEVGITPWISSWSWEGYEVVFNYDSPRQTLASFFRSIKRFSETQLERFGPLADTGDNGPIKTRLYEIIDRNRDDRMTAEEVQAAIRVPAHAQSLSQLIIRHESEWYYRSPTWDGLDELLGHSGSTPNLNWLAEKERFKQMSWWNKVAEQLGLPERGRVCYLHPLGMVGHFMRHRENECGCKFGKIFVCTRYVGEQTHYGPLFKGGVPLEKYPYWEESIANGVIAAEDKKIFIAMSANEGNLDSIHSYDSEMLTAGAMQKTIDPTGGGEFPKQVFDFRARHPVLYEELFLACGWSVEGTRGNAKMYYSHPILTNNEKCTGQDLKLIIRAGCSVAAYGDKVESKPLAAILVAISTREFYEQQVFDFSRRMKESVLEIFLSGYNLKVKDVFRSTLGKAVILDHHVNRPGNVAKDIKNSLDRFFSFNPGVSRDILSWGENHSDYEMVILDDYGVNRRMATAGGVSVAPARYAHLKSLL